jgi:hypothetical protein
MGVSIKSFALSNTLIKCFVTRKKRQCPELEETP